MCKLQMYFAILALSFASFVQAETYQQGIEAFNSADYEAALAVWQPLADSGDADAQFSIGQMYSNGFGVDMDDAAALNWYGKAAAQGHARAQCNLAVMYQNGWGVPQDETEAVRLYGLAAEQGDVEAMTALGRYYAMDYADAYDPVTAYKWFSLAARLQDIDADTKRETLAGRMTPEQIAQANQLAEAWSTSHEAMLANR